MRCIEPGCGRLLKAEDALCRACRRHKIHAIEVGDELVATDMRVLYNALASLPSRELESLRQALRGAYLPAARASVG